MSVHLNIGEIVLVTLPSDDNSNEFKTKEDDKRGIGLIRYIGIIYDQTQSLMRQYIGIELLQPSQHGHNGTFKGYNYFKTQMGHGLHIPLHQIIRKLSVSELFKMLQDMTFHCLKATLKTENIPSFLKIRPIDTVDPAYVFNKLNGEQQRPRVLSSPLSPVSQYTCPLSPSNASTIDTDMSRNTSISSPTNSTSSTHSCTKHIDIPSPAISDHTNVSNLYGIAKHSYHNIPMIDLNLDLVPHSDSNSDNESTASSHTDLCFSNFEPTPPSIKHTLGVPIYPGASSHIPIFDDKHKQHRRSMIVNRHHSVEAPTPDVPGNTAKHMKKTHESISVHENDAYLDASCVVHDSEHNPSLILNFPPKPCLRQSHSAKFVTSMIMTRPSLVQSHSVKSEAVNVVEDTSSWKSMRRDRNRQSISNMKKQSISIQRRKIACSTIQIESQTPRPKSASQSPKPKSASRSISMSKIKRWFGK